MSRGAQALKLLFLVAAALALLATSVHAPQCRDAVAFSRGPGTFTAQSTCGPAGTVTAALDTTTCALTVTGAAGVGLPSRGQVDYQGERLVLDDGPTRCEGRETQPGAYAFTCYREHTGTLGCGGSSLPTCEGTLTPAGP